jgi:hypothetical protein
MEDSVRGRRGTGAGKVYSSMAAATAPPALGTHLQPMYATHPNESRLQELLDLQRRRLGHGPGPGQYEVGGALHVHVLIDLSIKHVAHG